MKKSYSEFGEKLGSDTGILELMDDLGRAMTLGDARYMLGGGNPAHIPEVEECWRREWRRLAENEQTLAGVLGNYDPPAGNPHFRAALAELLNAECGWDVSADNIVITNGGQTAFFILFNMLAGRGVNPGHILMPMCPEYIGYADLGLSQDMMRTCLPKIEYRGDHEFKYHIDFNRLKVTGDTAAICVSRPTNPTGNVLTDEEVDGLHAQARQHDIPLIIDNAYGYPFPDILYRDVNPRWDEHIIYTLSLSKLGLPGTRTGVIVATPDICRRVAAVNAVVGLANGNIGQALTHQMVQDRSITRLSKQIIKPFYQEKSLLAQRAVFNSFDDRLPYRLHVSEGALFLWLWFDELPCSTRVLYERLKKRGVIVVPGSYFFYGLEHPPSYAEQCIRITYAQPDELVTEGIQIIAEEAALLYEQGDTAQE